MMTSSRFTRWMTLLALAATVAVALPARANTWPLPPPGSKVVGENRFHVVENNGGSLEAIAKKYNVGFLALLQANPGVDPYVPRAGSVLTIPLQTILPDAPREGMVINLAELRLYYYPPGKNEVTVYPIGIGQLGGDTLTPTMSPPSRINARIQPGPRRPTFVPAIRPRGSIFLPWCRLVRITRWGTTRYASRHTAASTCCTERMRTLASACASAPAVFVCAMTISKRCSTSLRRGLK